MCSSCACESRLVLNKLNKSSKFDVLFAATSDESISSLKFLNCDQSDAIAAAILTGGAVVEMNLIFFDSWAKGSRARQACVLSVRSADLKMLLLFYFCVLFRSNYTSECSAENPIIPLIPT
jgi:hypothetical protein